MKTPKELFAVVSTTASAPSYPTSDLRFDATRDVFTTLASAIRHKNHRNETKYGSVTNWRVIRFNREPGEVK